MGNLLNSVNAVNTANTANVRNTASDKRENIRRLVKYTNNEALQEVPDTFTSQTKSAVSSAAFFEGIPFVKFLMRNKHIEGALKSSKMLELDKITQESFKNIFSGDGSLISRIGNYINTANANKNIYQDLKGEAKLAAEAVKLDKKAGRTAEKISKLNSKLDIASQKVLDGRMKQKSFEKLSGRTAEITKRLMKKSGKIEKSIAGNSSKLARSSGKIEKLMETAGSAGKTAVKNTGRFGKFGKFLKSSGAGAMLVFSGIAELFSEIVPTFKELGAEKGIKQLGKSAVRVSGDTFGFIAGEQIGTAIGSAVGTAIFPGIGTAIGAVSGFAGGLLGSFALGRVTKAITGKSEREIAKEQQEDAYVSKIAGNEEELKKLTDKVFAKVKEDFDKNNGMLSEDAVNASNIAYQI